MTCVGEDSVKDSYSPMNDKLYKKRNNNRTVKINLIWTENTRMYRYREKT